MLDEASRYAGLPVREHLEPNGERIVYLARRFVPPPEVYQTTGSVTVTDSDRLDLIAQRALGSPAGAWQIADANGAMHPSELTATPSREVKIPMPRAARTKP